MRAQSIYQQNVDAGRTPTTDGVRGYVPEPVSGEPTPEEQALPDPQVGPQASAPMWALVAAPPRTTALTKTPPHCWNACSPSTASAASGRSSGSGFSRATSRDTIALIRDTPQYGTFPHDGGPQRSGEWR